ncbi:hypothetical protein EXIGLDRAFT_847702 [Exidia glandulosa HHB12029]|uniref:F-box domain-containing protein n=1 Tax=Exidia glandulosa HHB12029 TaxID=1314781 RepID=A0A166MP54_EXIGL|nr:hypothetical protein EXIGLDRAFT_847702 [Exidia glandulosa HHB12029]
MDCFHRIPTELVSYILDFLTQRDVLNVAATCARLKNVASAHQLFYRYISLRVPQPYYIANDVDSLALSPEIIRFEQSMDDARQAQRRVSVSIWIPFFSSPWWSNLNWDMIRSDYSLVIQQRVVATLGRSLQDYVISLTIHTQCFGGLFHGIFSTTPALYLRHLSLSLYDESDDSGYEEWHGNVISAEIFACLAPRLRSVEIDNRVTNYPIAAFSRVREVILTSGLIPLHDVALHFPQVQHLTFTVNITYLPRCYDCNEEETAAAVIVLQTMLRSLRFTLDDSECSSTVAPLAGLLFGACTSIPLVDIELGDTSYIPDLAPLLQAFVRHGPFTINLHYYSCPSLDKLVDVMHLVDEDEPWDDVVYEDMNRAFDDRVMFRMSSCSTEHTLAARFAALGLHWCLNELRIIRSSITTLHIFYLYLQPRCLALEAVASLPGLQTLYIDLVSHFRLDWELRYLLESLAALKASSTERDPLSGDDVCQRDIDGSSTDRQDFAAESSWWPVVTEVAFFASNLDPSMPRTVMVSPADIALYATHICLPAQSQGAQSPTLQVYETVTVFGDDLLPLHEIFSAVTIDDLRPSTLQSVRPVSEMYPD